MVMVRDWAPVRVLKVAAASCPLGKAGLESQLVPVIQEPVVAREVQVAEDCARAMPEDRRQRTEVRRQRAEGRRRERVASSG